MKKSFVMYTEYMEQIALLTMEQRGLLFTAVMSYVEDGSIPAMDAVTVMAFSFIKSRIDWDAKKYADTVAKRKEAGKLGGRPKAGGFPEKQDKAKKANGFFEKQNNPDNVPVLDTDIDIDKDKVQKSVVRQSRFVPPTRLELTAYCEEHGYTLDIDRFLDFYECKGWMVGKNKMKDWRAAARNWDRSQRQELTTKAKKNRFCNFEQRNTDFDALEKQLIGGKDISGA